MGISIAIEGSEGAGKSLLASITTDLLRTTTDLSVIVTREPGGTALGEMVRGILKGEDFRGMHPMTSVFLFSAQRSELFHKVEEPFLRDNPTGVLIKDRSWLSTVALQVAEGADSGFIDTIQSPFRNIPDKFAIIDIPVLETVVRMMAEFKYSSNREIDWRDKQTQENLVRYRDNYLAFAVENKDKCLILDCFDDPWNKAAIIKLDMFKILAEREGEVLPNEGQLLNTFSEGARMMVQADSEKDEQWQKYGIEARRKAVEKARVELNYPSREELRAKMHDEWRSLGLEGAFSGVERR